MIKIIKQSALLLLLGLSSIQHSSATETDEKIFISADHMQLNINTGHSVYTGKVKISQGDLVLTGDKVTLQQNDKEIEQLTVIGKPARYNHVTEKGESIEAESEKMVYTSSQNKLVMTTNARLIQPDHQVSSQRIVYDTEKKIVIAGDKKGKHADSEDNPELRVKITLTPKKAADTEPKEE